MKTKLTSIKDQISTGNLIYSTPNNEISTKVGNMLLCLHEVEDNIFSSIGLNVLGHPIRNQVYQHLYDDTNHEN